MRKRAFSLVVFAILAFQVGALTSAEADAVGRLTQVEGRVDILRGGQLPATPVKVDDGVQTGDVLRTKSLSKAQITFIDNSTLTIAPESRVGIEAYMFDAAQNKRSAVVQLFQGLASVVVNKVLKSAEPDFVVKTHTAIMGVRGTEFGIRLHPNSSTILNFEGVLQVGNVVPEVTQLFRRAFKIAYSFSSEGRGSQKWVFLKSMQGTSVGRGHLPTPPFAVSPSDQKSFMGQMASGLSSRKGGRDSGGGEGGTKGGAGTAGSGGSGTGASGTASPEIGGSGTASSGTSGEGAAGGGYGGLAVNTFLDQGTAKTGTGSTTLTPGFFLSNSMISNTNLLGGSVVGGSTIANTVSPQQVQTVTGTTSTPATPVTQPTVETPVTQPTVVTPVTQPTVVTPVTQPPVVTQLSYPINMTLTQLPYAMTSIPNGTQATFTGALPLTNSTVNYAVQALDQTGPGGFAYDAKAAKAGQPSNTGTINWSVTGTLTGTSATGTVTGPVTATGTTSGGTILTVTVPLTATDQNNKLTNVTNGPITGTSTVVTPTAPGSDYNSPGKSGKASDGSATATFTKTAKP